MYDLTLRRDEWFGKCLVVAVFLGYTKGEDECLHLLCAVGWVR
jgi:hypothetical protein